MGLAGNHIYHDFKGDRMKADDIRQLRQSLAWSQEALARKLGVSFSTVNRWENGKAAPSPMAKKGLDDLLPLKQTSAQAAPFVHSAVEKRNYGRLNLCCSLYISRGRTVGASGVHCNKCDEAEAFALDLGPGGMRFNTSLDVKAGEELNLSFVSVDTAMLRGRSEVVWTHEKDGVCQVGVRFDGIRPEDLFGVVAAMAKH